MTTQLDLLDRDWVTANVPRVLAFIATTDGRTWTCDDLRAHVTEPENRNWFGVLLAKLKNDGVIERAGYQPSTRPEANGRVIAAWRRAAK